MAFGAVKKIPFDIEIVIGLIILAIGAVILLKHYDYLPRDFLRDIDLTLIAGIGCVVGGLFFLFKKLTEKKLF